MREMVTKSVVVVAALFLAGCAGSVRSDVLRFHQVTPPRGETVRIVPADEDKIGSLEFETYAGYVRARLIEQGYQPVATESDILVELDYDVSDPRVRVRGTSGASFGFGFGPYGYFGHPFFFRSGFAAFPYYYNNTYSYEVFDRRLSIDMVRAETGEVVFEGRLRSIGREPDLPEVMPYLVEAMFVDFPGENGRTERVVVQREN
ncbi:MAG: DUF4136 domain-containing protein [Rhodothalassiaceae bacterium]